MDLKSNVHVVPEDGRSCLRPKLDRLPITRQPFSTSMFNACFLLGTCRIATKSLLHTWRECVVTKSNKSQLALQWLSTVAIVVCVPPYHPLACRMSTEEVTSGQMCMVSSPINVKLDSISSFFQPNSGASGSPVRPPVFNPVSCTLIRVCPSHPQGCPSHERIALLHRNDCDQRLGLTTLDREECQASHLRLTRSPNSP